MANTFSHRNSMAINQHKFV